MSCVCRGESPLDSLTLSFARHLGLVVHSTRVNHLHLILRWSFNHLNISHPPYIGRHLVGTRGRGGGRGSASLFYLVTNTFYFSEVFREIPILRREFFEGELKGFPNLSFSYILIISKRGHNVKSFFHFFLESHRGGS